MREAQEYWSGELIPFPDLPNPGIEPGPPALQVDSLPAELQGDINPLIIHWDLQSSLESPLDCKEIQPVHSKEDQSWVFIGKTDFGAETPILWPPDVKN